MVKSVPDTYIKKIPNFYLKNHVYTITSNDQLPISFFRAKDADFVTTELRLDKNCTIVIDEEKPASLLNQSYEVFNFTNSRMLHFDHFISNDKIFKISLKGKNITFIKKETNLIIVKFSSDFEILLNDDRFFYVETKNEMFAILKKTGNKMQLYIVEVQDHSNLKNVLVYFE